MDRVVVVDDETMARKGIILTIDWSALDCVIVGEAANGEEGAEHVKRLSPDLWSRCSDGVERLLPGALHYPDGIQ